MSLSPDILKAQNEVADKYLDDLKKELGMLQKGVVTLVEKKLRTIMLQENAIPESIQDIHLTKFEKFLISLSPKTADKVFNFLKEKHKLIQQSKTIEELQNLKSGIINTPKSAVTDPTIAPNQSSSPENKSVSAKDVQPDPVAVDKKSNPYVDIGVVGGSTIAEGSQALINRGINSAKAEKLALELNEAGLRRGMDDVVKTLEAKLRDDRLLPKQKKNIEKMLETFKNASTSAGSVEELKIWKTLVSKNILSNSVFETCKINAEAALELTKITKNAALMAELAVADSAEKVTATLTKYGITGLTPETLALFQNAKTVEEVEGIAKVLSKSEELTKLAKAAKAFPFLDMAIYGIEIYHFWGQEKNEKNITHFAINTAVYGVTAAWGLAAWGGLVAAGPGGWVVLGGVVLAETANYAVDACYFNIKEFYNKQKADFIKQSRTELKQGIIQAAAGASRSNVSINETICDWIPGSPSGNRKKQTVNDAMRGLIYTEEVGAYQTVAIVDKSGTYDKLDANQKKEYDEQKKELEAKIESRMQYIRTFLPDGASFLQFSNAIKTGKSVQFIEKIVADSSVYKAMKEDPKTSVDSIDEYKTEKRKNLESSNGDLCKKLDLFVKKDKYQVAEFFSYVIACSKEEWHLDNPEDVFYADDMKMKPIVDYMMQYIDWYYMGVPNEQKPQLTNFADINFVEVHQQIINIADGGEINMSPTVYTELKVKDNLVSEVDSESRFQDALEYSTDVRQNIIYRIAKEFHGYSGRNNLQELKSYFLEGGEAKKGLYYEEGGFDNNDGRRMNLDWGVDARMNFASLEKKTPEQLMTQWFDIYKMPDGNLFMFNENTGLDGETETVDRHINQEFFTKIYNILKEEKESLGVDYKKKVEIEIAEYIKKHAKDGYIKLPSYLVMKAARAGLGKMQYRYFTAKDNKISGITTNEYISSIMTLPGVVKQYVDNPDGNKKTLTEDQINALPIKTIAGGEKAVVDKVDVASKIIEKTVGALTWSDERGDILYDAMKKTLRSRGGDMALEEKNGKWIVAKGELNIQYNDVQEAVYVANMLNWMRKYKKDHPNLELVYYNGTGGNRGRGKGLYDVNTGFFNTDTRLISQSHINSKYDQTFTGDNYKLFMQYIENKLT